MVITLPLESTIYLSKNGEMRIEHTTMVTGEIGQAFVEAAVKAMGGSVDDAVNQQHDPTGRVNL